MTKLGIIVASARPNRVGEHVTRWMRNQLSGRLEVDLIDLREVALPAFDEPASPKSGAEPTTPHARSWTERIASLDALAIVTPQYNGSYPGQLKTAIDFLHAEWKGLPILLVGYGWGDAAEVLAHLEALMTRLDARVLGSIGLGFREDLGVEGELFVREQKTAQLRDGLEALETAVLAPVG